MIKQLETSKMSDHFSTFIGQTSELEEDAKFKFCTLRDYSSWFVKSLEKAVFPFKLLPL